MIEIYINDVSIDLFEGTSIALNYTNAEIVNLTTKGNFSYSVTVPASSLNRKTFVFPELDAEEAFNSQVKNDCRIEYNGTVILDGFALISTITNEGGVYSYEITCFDGNSTWINELKDKRLTDLDLSDFNHTYTKANIDASENWTLNSRYIYPLINYGVLTDNYVVQDRTPWLNTYHIFNQIFQNQGYSINSQFLTSEFFRKLYFSPKGLPSIADSVIEANKFNVGFYGASGQANQTYITYDGNDVGYNTRIAVKFDKETKTTVFSGTANEQTFLLHDTDNNDFNTTSSFTASIRPHSFKSNITARMSFEWNFGFTAVNTSILGKSEKQILLEVVRVRNGVATVIGSQLQYIPSIGGNGANVLWNVGKSVELLGTLTTEATDIYAGDFVFCSATLKELTTSGHYIYYKPALNNTFKNEVYSNLVTGQTVELNRLLPDISQVDFLNDIKTMFNLYFYTNEYFKTVYIEPRDSFYSQTATDWSSKLDISKPITHTYLGETLNKEMEFSYKEDSGEDYIKVKERDLNEGYSWGSFRYDITNVNASEGRGEIKTKIFCPTYTGAGLPDAPTANIPIIWRDNNHDSNYFDHDYRIMYYRGRIALPTGQFWKFENAIRTDYPAMSMQYDSNGGNDNSLFWKNTGLVQGLFYKFWHNTINALDNSKIVKAYINLSPRDINNLDFRSPIYLSIEGNGDYYHLQRISNYTPTEIGSFECELVRVLSPMPLVELTEIIPPLVNETPPLGQAEPTAQLKYMKTTIPTRVIINNVEQTVDMVYDMISTRKPIVGSPINFRLKTY